MKYLDLTLPTTAENLACDEALLDTAEDGEGGELLRFWESPDYFVVVGYANKVATEVNVAACRARGVPILRRCSGGGAVLQGPGCLNYALVLRIGDDGPLRSIGTANRFILERNRAAIEALLAQPTETECGCVRSTSRGNPKVTDTLPLGLRLQPRSIRIRGQTDLTLGGRKFSGNSQRRRRRFLLFHGSFLLHFDLGLIAELLPLPSKQPDYRQNRSHADFLANLNVPADAVKAALRQAWGATVEATEIPESQIRKLATEKYSSDAWNFKF